MKVLRRLQSASSVIFLVASTRLEATSWCRPGKVGVRFRARIEVSAWTPGGSTAQQRVDRMVQRVKADAVPLGTEDRSNSQGFSSSDLELLAKAVDSLSDALADNPGIVSRCGTNLQALDVASQVLRKLSKRTSSLSSGQ